MMVCNMCKSIPKIRFYNSVGLLISVVVAFVESWLYFKFEHAKIVRALEQPSFFRFFSFFASCVAHIKNSQFKYLLEMSECFL